MFGRLPNTITMSDEQTNEQSKVNEQVQGEQTPETPKPEVVESGVEDFSEARRRDPSKVRTMNASSFKIASEPKPEPKPEPIPEPPVTPVVAVPQPQPQPPLQASQPAPEPRPPVQTSDPGNVAASQPRPPIQDARPPTPLARPPEPRQPVPEMRPPVQETRPPEAMPPQPEPRPPVQDDPGFAAPHSAPVQDDHARYDQNTSDNVAQQPWDHMEPKNSTNSAGNIIDAFKGAISFFTLVKFNVGEKERNALDKNMFVAPIVGAILGTILAVISICLWQIGAPSVLIAAIVLGGSLVASKFLHFDGLVDFGDGMVVSGDREDHIRALKDSAIGAGGMGLAFVVVMISFAAMASIGNPIFLIPIAIVTAEVFAKNGMVAAAVFGKPGNGMAGEQVRSSNIMTLILSTVFSVVISFVLFFIIAVLVVAISPFESVDLFWRGLISIGAAAGVSVLSGFLVSYLAEKNFGYVNGDCLGAAHEISRALSLIAIVCVVFAL